MTRSPLLFISLITLAGLLPATSQAQPARRVVPEPARNNKVIEAKKTYDKANEAVKEAIKSLSSARIELQKMINGRSVATERFTNTTFKTAESDLIAKQSEMNLLKKQILSEANDPELQQYQDEITHLESALRKTRLQSTPGEPNRQLIDLSQRLNEARKILTRHENTLLQKNEAYAMASAEVDSMKKNIISLKKELMVHRQNSTAMNQQSPEAQAQRQAIANAMMIHTDAVKQQKEAKKAWEQALAIASKEYAEYQQLKKEIERRQQIRSGNWRNGTGRANRRTRRF